MVRLAVAPPDQPESGGWPDGPQGFGWPVPLDAGGSGLNSAQEDDMANQDGRTCVVVRGVRAVTGRQGLPIFEGVSAQSAGAQGLCLHRLEIPPGGAARPHLHEHHESAVFVLSGRAEMRYGERLAQRLQVGAGDFLYIPPGMPHQPANLSATEPCTAVVARTDPDEQESVVLLDEEGRRADLA